MNQRVCIDYTNWRGERRTRKIIPIKLEFKSTEHHAEQQWILEAVDVERCEIRSFTMKDVHSWTPSVVEERCCSKCGSNNIDPATGACGTCGHY